MLIIGIDNGLDGGIVRMDDDGTIETWIMPTVTLKVRGQTRRRYDLELIAKHVKCWGLDLDLHVFIESAHPSPRDGTQAAFTTGRGFGVWEGMLTLADIPTQTVEPQVWQPRLLDRRLQLEKGPKAAALAAVKVLFPDIDLRASERCRVPHTGIVDALLIAEYGRRMMMEGMNHGS